MLDLLFEYVQPMQWWAYIILGTFVVMLVAAWATADNKYFNLKQLWEDTDRLKGEIMGESYDLVSFNGGKTYYQIYKGGRLELAPADLVAMVKAHKAAEGMGLDPDMLEQIGPIFTRKAPPPVDIDGDGKPAGRRSDFPWGDDPLQ